MTGVPIEIRSVPVPALREEGILSARVSHGRTGSGGVAVRGWNHVVLCAGCDADTPHAASLITWSRVHGRVEGDDCHG